MRIISEEQGREEIKKILLGWDGPLYIRIDKFGMGGDCLEYIVYNPNEVDNIIDLPKKSEIVFAPISHESWSQTSCSKNLLDLCWNFSNEYDEWGIALPLDDSNGWNWEINWVSDIIPFIKENINRSALFIKVDPIALPLTKFYIE